MSRRREAGAIDAGWPGQLVVRVAERSAATGGREETTHDRLLHANSRADLLSSHPAAGRDDPDNELSGPPDCSLAQIKGNDLSSRLLVPAIRKSGSNSNSKVGHFRPIPTQRSAATGGREETTHDRLLHANSRADLLSSHPAAGRDDPDNELSGPPDCSLAQIKGNDLSSRLLVPAIRKSGSNSNSKVGHFRPIPTQRSAATGGREETTHDRLLHANSRADLLSSHPAAGRDDPDNELSGPPDCSLAQIKGNELWSRLLVPVIRKSEPSSSSIAPRTPRDLP